jgi:hypothetical protein
MRVDDVIAAACEELNCSYEANALWFEVLINQAMRSHKTSNKLQQKDVTLEIYDNKIQIPSDWNRIVGIYHKASGEKYCPDIDYAIQNDCAIFDSALNFSDGDKVIFRYMGLAMDKDGQVVIPDDWERMLVAYIGWKYTRRYNRDFNMGIMQNFQREYQTQKLANI